MTREQKQSYWFEHIHAWRGSGLSKADYCSFHDLSLTSLMYWLRRERIVESGGNPPRVLDMVPVRIAPDINVVTDSIVVRGPGGWTLELPPQVPASWVAALLGALA